MKLFPIVALVLVAGLAQAHEGESHAAVLAAHGGEVKSAGAYHYELVVAADASEARESPLLVFVTDASGRAVATAGAGGTATLLTGKAKTTITLTPDGGNRMKGLGRYGAVPSLKVLVALSLPGKAAEQARFTPLADR